MLSGYMMRDYEDNTKNPSPRQNVSETFSLPSDRLFSDQFRSAGVLEKQTEMKAFSSRYLIRT